MEAHDDVEKYAHKIVDTMILKKSKPNRNNNDNSEYIQIMNEKHNNKYIMISGGVGIKNGMMIDNVDANTDGVNYRLISNKNTNDHSKYIVDLMNHIKKEIISRHKYVINMPKYIPQEEYEFNIRNNDNVFINITNYKNITYNLNAELFCHVLNDCQINYLLFLKGIYLTDDKFLFDVSLLRTFANDNMIEQIKDNSAKAWMLNIVNFKQSMYIRKLNSNNIYRKTGNNANTTQIIKKIEQIKVNSSKL